MPILTNVFEKTTAHYSFICGVLIVLALVSFNQMVGANALRSVASVEQVFSPISLFEEPSSMMGIKTFAAARIDSSISSLIATGYPKPAIIGFENLLPESFAQRAHGDAILSCDDSLWKKHIYHSYRLQVDNPCTVATGVIVDATHGKNKDGCRHEADGDGHCWLKLDPGQEQFLNQGNLDKQEGNLVFEPICRYRVTQEDAKAACKNYKQPLVIPPVGTHVRMVGAAVTDLQHGHKEFHPVWSITVLPEESRAH